MFAKNAYDVWKEERDAGFIVTLCKEFDDALGGGIRVGAITEFIGGAGAGKTEICLQLCVNSQIPVQIGGLEGAAVYVDTNRGFTIHRMKEIASALEIHYQHICRMNNICPLSSFTAKTILDNIHCTFCNNYVELMAVIYGLGNFLEKNRNVRLVVIDSFSYLFRAIESDINVTQITYEALSQLQDIVELYRCAVVITNEMTTRVDADGNTEIVPSLGESHSHRVNFQIRVSKDVDDPRRFCANIDKSFVKCEAAASFEITVDGLRDYRKSRAE